MSLKIYAEIMREDTSRQLREAFSRVEDITLSMHVPVDESVLKRIGTEEMPDVLIIEIEDESEGEIELIEKVLKSNMGKLTPYIIYESCSSETMRRLMKVGVKDFLPLPFQSQEFLLSLMDVMSEKREKVETASKSGGVVAFLDVKGGGGASTLAMNVAHTLATKFEAKTALIDFDIQFGTSALSLDLNPSSTIMDALADVDRIDPVFLKALMAKHKSGLDVLPSPADIEPIDGITVEGVKHLLESMSDNYEFIVLDVPRVFTDWMVAVLKLADPLMLVVHHDLDSVRDAKVILNTLPTMGVSISKVEVVNNRAMTTLEETTIQQLKKTLKKEKVHRVRNDYKTAIHARESGLPLIEVSKHSDMTADIIKLAGYVAEMHRGKPAEREGLFSKLFGGK
jgi:pilus assembly protein CpaE